MVFGYHHFGRTLVLLHNSVFHYTMTLNLGAELKQWVLSLLTSLYAHRSGTVIQQLFSEDGWIKWTLFSLFYVRWGIIWFFWNVTVVDNLYVLHIHLSFCLTVSAGIVFNIHTLHVCRVCQQFLPAYCICLQCWKIIEIWSYKIINPL